MTEQEEVPWDLIRYLIPEDIKTSQLYYQIIQMRRYERDNALKQRQMDKCRKYYEENRKNMYKTAHEYTQKKAQMLRTKFLNERIIVYFD